MTSLHLVIPAQLDQLEVVCDAVEQAAMAAGFDERTRYACQLAVTEACENIVKHGYGNAASGGSIELRLEATLGELRIELIDGAPPFNPAAAPTVAEWDLDDPPVGGLGLLIMHRVMDSLDYQRAEGKNRLVMLKRQEPQA